MGTLNLDDKTEKAIRKFFKKQGLNEGDTLDLKTYDNKDGNGIIDDDERKEADLKKSVLKAFNKVLQQLKYKQIVAETTKREEATSNFLETVRLNEIGSENVDFPDQGINEITGITDRHGNLLQGVSPEVALNTDGTLRDDRIIEKGGIPRYSGEQACKDKLSGTPSAGINVPVYQEQEKVINIGGEEIRVSFNDPGFMPSVQREQEDSSAYIDYGKLQLPPSRYRVNNDDLKYPYLEEIPRSKIFRNTLPL